MEAAVVGAAIGATVKVVLQNLISVSTKEIKLIRGYKKDLEKLRSTLITIQTYVYGAEMLQVSDISVKRWLKKLEDSAFDAYYVLDEVHYISLRKDRHKMEIKTALTRKIKSIASGSNFYDRLKLGRKIGDINKEFDIINREASVLGLPTRLAGLHAIGAAAPAFAGLETDSYTFDPVFLGRGNDVMEIVEKLSNLPTDRVFSILPIVGMGGMGKSTLAREVVKVQTHFGTRIWVHVSADFDPVVIFKKILMILTSEDVKVENREVVLQKLQEALRQKTYLLVLDDVWTEERLNWEGFINSLAGTTSTKGNAIIVTTRKGNVASIVATLSVHDLQGLSEDSCWAIIKAKAFGGDVIPSEFETLGKKIATRCQGLPLAANVVGGVLRGKCKDEWVSLQENWISNHVEGDFIQKVLKLSFDNLPSPSLKKCFAYCSIFPKGWDMLRVDLIHLWMAEGYLEADKKSDMEIVGNEIFNLLLHSSLLQDVVRDNYNNVLHCRMHDLVHDVAMKVNDNILDGINRARYIGHEFYRDEPKEKAKYVRTLFFEGGVFDAMFSNFKSLHVLTLMGYDVKELPSSIRELMHLRYLNISKTSIEDLPETIGELYHLQTFRAHSLSLKKLPSTIKYLIGLRHLHVFDQTKLPGELGTLTSLRTIPYFAVGDEKGHRIVELGSLENLEGKLKIYNLEKVRDKEEAESACIFKKPNIVELVLQWNESEEGGTDHENVLEGLQPHHNLKSLEIVGFKGKRFPSWALKMGIQDERRWKGLDNLMDITIKSCSECEEIPMMGHLPHLRSLCLDDLSNVKSIGSSFYGIDHCISNNDTIIVFPALQLLRLLRMPKMREWVEVELTSQSHQVKVFPCLEYLVISNCEQLKSAPSHFPCLKELQIHKMNSGLPLGNICGTNLTSLTKLQILELEELESLPHWLFYNNQHLSELEIWDCHRLRELTNGLHTLDLRIQSCSSLKSIASGSFTSLRSLVIEDCPKLMNLSAKMVESFAPSLQCLQLRGLRGLMNTQMIIDSLHKMPRLTELALALPKSHHILPLSGKPDWKSLPDQLQHLSAIRELRLSDFGIQELSEWFGNLSSLTVLSLSNCKRLKSVASLEAMRRLTNLTHLSIYNCPLLTERGIERQSSDHDSKWPKISHIPYIWVDGRELKRVQLS